MDVVHSEGRESNVFRGKKAGCTLLCPFYLDIQKPRKAFKVLSLLIYVLLTPSPQRQSVKAAEVTQIRILCLELTLSEGCLESLVGYLELFLILYFSFLASIYVFVFKSWCEKGNLGG